MCPVKKDIVSHQQCFCPSASIVDFGWELQGSFLVLGGPCNPVLLAYPVVLLEWGGREAGTLHRGFSCLLGGSSLRIWPLGSTVGDGGTAQEGCVVSKGCWESRDGSTGHSGRSGRGERRRGQPRRRPPCRHRLCQSVSHVLTLKYYFYFP